MADAVVSLPQQSRPLAAALRMLPDERLAKLAAAGDTNAFAAIYERHHAAIYRYCRSIVHDPDDATDALQNAMMNALKGLVDRGRDVPLRPWLFRIAHNESISLIRRRRPHEELIESAGAIGAGPEDDAELREQIRQLVADMRLLPDRQRGALVMRELNGLSYEDIAAAFGTTVAAAKQTVYEARQALHEHAAGRELPCDEVRKTISAGDRRILRGRKVRSHLSACTECNRFKDAIGARRAGLAALAPPPSAATSAALLEAILGGSGGGAGGGGVLAAVTGSAAKIATAGVATKTIVAATVAVTAGSAAGVASGNLPLDIGALGGGSSSIVRDGGSGAGAKPIEVPDEGTTGLDEGLLQEPPLERQQAAQEQGAGDGAGSGNDSSSDSDGSSGGQVRRRRVLPQPGRGVGGPLELPRVETPDLPPVQAPQPEAPRQPPPRVDPPSTPELPSLPLP